MTAHNPPRRRAERLIGTGRVGLAAIALVAIWAEPSGVVGPAWAAVGFSGGYLVCALVILLRLWCSPAPLGRLPFILHTFDLAAFCLVEFFAQDATGPLAISAAFLLASATLRWLWHGALWTAVAVLSAHAGLSMLARHLGAAPAIEPAHLVVHSLYLALMAILLGGLGAYEERAREEISRLAPWSRALPQDAPALVRDLVENAATLLTSPRVLMGWEEPEEPWFHLASWSRGEFRWNRQPLGAYEPVVAEPLSGTDFLCLDARAAAPTCLHTSAAGLRRRREVPLHPDLQARFNIGSVLSLRLQGEVVKGRLFCLDIPGLTADDLALGEVVARQVASRMDHFYLLHRLQQAAATEERIKLARQLHDGVLQSLTGAALQLQTVGPLLDTDPEAACARLLLIQRLLAEEQRDLRFFIQELRPAPLGLPGTDSNLGARLTELGARIERHWGLRVELRVEQAEARISEALLREIYLIVHEALVNAARHAKASAARVEVGVLDNEMRVIVADNGCGFRFRGRYDHAALVEKKLGPVTLKERIIALNGTIAIDSDESGARLQISLPLVPPGE